MSSNFKKLISVFLAVIMIVSGIPTSVYANAITPGNPDKELPNNTITEHNDEDSDNTESEPAIILSEDTEKREENVKHFRMSDGTIQAAQYAEPVHFLRDGVWTDYDNTLTEEDADEEENTNNSLLKNKDLTNQTADYSVRLSKKTNGKKFVRIEKDGYKLSWYYKDAKKSTAKILQAKDDGDQTTLEKLSSAVVYNNVFKATNFEYIIGSTGLKENIILKSKKAPQEFTAEYKANGLTPVQVNDKTIELRTADGTVIYTLSAPFMTDESGEYSDSVSLTLESVKNNTFTVKISLDSTWLNASDRTYPVTVDPAIQTKQEPSAMTSTFVDSAHPTTAHANGTNDAGSMYIGCRISEYGTARTYIKANTLPDIGGIGSKVIDARLYICKRNVYSTTDKVQVNAYKITSSWNAGSLTYNNQPTHESSIVDYMLFNADNKVQSDYHDNYGYSEFKTLEITELVRGWYENTQNNYGIMLDTKATNTHKVWFFSIQYATYTETRPVLTVSYRNMSGYEDYWSYTSVSAGRNGSIDVNNFNGNLVFSQPVTQGDGGNLMPVSLSLVYNSNGASYLKANETFTYMGAKMQTNYHIYVRAESGQLAANGYKYYLNDSDGTKHWFYFANNSTTDGKDEDGLGYKLKVIAVGSDANDSSAKFVITDKDDNKMYFNTSGNLTKIRNAAGVSATVSYQIQNNKPRINTITDGAGRKYTFNYNYSNNPNLCTSIQDPAGRITSFSYSDKAMTSIKFSDSKTVTLSQNGEFLSSVTAIDGTRTNINYDGSAQKRVIQINWGSSDSNLLEKYSFAYKQNETSVTDIQGRKYTYQFNNFGQTTGVVSNTDGSAQFFKLHEGNTTDNRANKLLQESRVLKTVTNYAINPGFTNNLTGFSKAIESTTGNPSITVDTTKGYLTKNSLKIVKPTSNVGYCSALQTISGLPEGDYTFSCYVNTEGQTISGGGVYVGYKVLDSNNAVLKEEKADAVYKTNGWERVSITFNIQQGQKARLVIGTEGGSANACGTMWFDDLQLEKSSGASSYNLIENSAVTNGVTGWGAHAVECSITDLPDFSHAVHIGSNKTSPSTKVGLFHRIYTVPGKKGDVFSFGSWVKGDSAPINNLKNDDPHTPIFEIALHFYDSSEKWLKKVTVAVNEDLNTWQFVSGKAIAPVDYDHIGIEIDYSYNVNDAYATGAFCFKEEFGQTYTYDKDGNVVSAVDLAKTNSTFSYYGNQMSKMLNPSGSRYLYSYDSQKKLNYALSSDGQEYGFKYDDKGNVTKTEITARNPASSVEAGKEYIIVNAYSGKSLDSGSTGIVSDDTYTSPYNPSSVYQRWKLVSTGTDGVYRINPAGFPNKPTLCLDVCNNLAVDGTIIQIHEWHGYPAQKFKIEKSDNGTFIIKTASSVFASALDAQYEEKDLTEKQIVKQKTVSDTDESIKWYFYPVEKSDSRTIVTETAYTNSKNFVKSTKDQRGNETNYVYNEDKGTLTSATDALGRTTNYTYDANNNSLLSVSSGGMTNSYSYNNDRLSTITVNGGLKYNFQYDAFGRTTATKVGNGTSWRTLSSLTYGGNGLLSKQTYGNGDYVNFDYDNLDRIIGKQYNGKSRRLAIYRYGNDGNLAQTFDSSTLTRTNFTYDLANRLVSQKEYESMDTNGGTLCSSLDYTYANKTNYLTGIKHYSPLGTYDITFTRDSSTPDQVSAIWWNNNVKLSHHYDSLGRMEQKAYWIGLRLITNEFTYVNVGENKTTTLPATVKTIAGTYSYTYDAVGNITSVSLDDKYTNTYEYDSLNQLVRENNQQIGKTYTYEYSNGNIYDCTEYAYTTGELGEMLDCKVWFYSNNTWRDLVTSFNLKPITYDEIGNPLTMGSKTLSWMGRQLESITDGENTYAYVYNMDGQRVSKTVNGVKTEYFYYGSTLAGQITGNNKLIFMNDENGNPFAFTYNGAEYFYIKNAQNDVTGIIDSSTRTVIAMYVYDAWGNMISVTDAEGNEITDTNHIAHINPLRYRSYYFDSETGFYYLKSRYYSPEMCRFLNADLFTQTGQGLNDKNLFAYCLNNPINYSDYGGTISIVALIVTGLSIGLAVFSSYLISSIANKTNEPTTIKPPDVAKAVSGEVSDTAKVINGATDITSGYNNAMNQRRQHAKNMVTASYAKINKIPFSAINISPIIFSSDAAYTRYCLSKVDSFNDFLEGSGRNLRGKQWDDLSEDDQQFIAHNSIIWDDSFTIDDGKNNGSVAGFSAFSFY